MTVYSSRDSYIFDKVRARKLLGRLGFSEGDINRIFVLGLHGCSCEIMKHGRVVAEPKITACICPGVWD